MKEKLGYLYILLAGICWSTIGFIVSKISDYNFSSEEIAFFRMSVGCIVLGIYGKLFVPTMFKITKRGVFYALGVGVFSQAIFNISYLGSICEVGASMAAVLLYTSPIFVAIFSRVFYKEKIGRTKQISLLFCVVGAFLAVTGGSMDLSNVSLIGVVLGIMAAVTYALLPIFSKNGLKEMDSITMTTYSFFIAVVILCFRINPVETISKIDGIVVLLYVLAIGIIPTVFAYIVYTKGISMGLELSIVGVIASIELVLSVIIGWTLLDEGFSIVKLVGVLFMIASTFIALKAIDDSKEDSKKDIEEVILN